MKENSRKITYLKDYRPSDYLLDTVQLHFQLEPDNTLVTNSMQFRCNPQLRYAKKPLILAGKNLEWDKLTINGKKIPANDYDYDGNHLTLYQVPEKCEVKIETQLCPKDNTSLEGLWMSRDMFFTQCEPEGFRRITFHPDRPDVLSTYTTTIEACPKTFPILLSNGNLKSKRQLFRRNRQRITWHDPFPKPSYLFALVAGDLQKIEDRFVTQSGRKIKLQMYVEEKDLDKCHHAIASLKHAMKWDEVNFAREYDLDIFMIVAVDDFNMGAMENKGLNIFNTECVLATPKLSTDNMYLQVENIVAHEYLHNWSGNRITCRDWFQLSLKEGLTVFRDSLFSQAQGLAAHKRIERIRQLLTVQFAEDASPLSHPVQPDSYLEISNFYTHTIYEKGAELFRMLQLIVGEEVFRRATIHYFEKYDGQAVTLDDFIHAVEEISGKNLQQFRYWYKISGTPRLQLTTEYDSDNARFTLNFTQLEPKSANNSKPVPLFHIPVLTTLIDNKGPLCSASLSQGGGRAVNDHEFLLEINEKKQHFVFENIHREPEISLLRGLSAPVKVIYTQTHDSLSALMLRDNDPYNRWMASRNMMLHAIQAIMDDLSNDNSPQVNPELIKHYKTLLDTDNDLVILPLLLQVPDEYYIASRQKVIHVDHIHQARELLQRKLALELKGLWQEKYDMLNTQENYCYNATKAAQREFKNLCLGYLVKGDDENAFELCFTQFNSADNMTDQIAAMTLLAHTPSNTAKPLAKKVLANFYQQFSDEPLAINNWLRVQATAPLPETLENVNKLMAHQVFDLTNPNKIRALIMAFCATNPTQFHVPDGSGYRFLSEQILKIDPLNPQMAARMVTLFSQWRNFPRGNKKLMEVQLKQLLEQNELSDDCSEIATKTLQ